MRITRLALTDIRRHRSLEVRPAPGLTVIRGPNESGKSTVQLALELVLFRRATSTAADTLAMRSWDATGDPTVELEFESDGHSGRLVKRFAGTRGQVALSLDGVAESDPNRVEHLVVAALGIPSEKFLRSTASVRHFEMEDLARDEKALRDRLQQSIGGGDVSASRVRQKLDETIRRYRAAGTKNPGPLLRVRDDIARLTAELRRGETALEELSRDRAALASAGAARIALEDEVRAASASLDEAETAVKLEADRQAATEQYEGLRRATDVAERLAAAEHDAPVAMPVAELRPMVDRLRSVELRAAQLAAERAALLAPEPVTDASPGFPASQPPYVRPSAPTSPGTRPADPVADATRGPWRGLAMVLLTLAVLALIAGVLVSAIGPLIGVLAAIVLGASAGGAWLRGARAASAAASASEGARRVASADPDHHAGGSVGPPDARPLDAEADAQVAAARSAEARAAIDDGIARDRAEASSLLARLGVPDLATAEAMLLTAEAHAATVHGLRAELRGSLGLPAGASGPSLDELRRARDDAAAKVALAGHALEGLGVAGADPESARARAQGQVRGAQLRLRGAIDEEGQAKGRVSRNSVDAEAVAATAEALAARQEELTLLERKLRIYEQTLIAVAAAESVTMQKAARYLERHMGEDMARLTGGRYERVRVDENDLGITVWSPEGHAWVDASQLSKGTADQLYLAARLGLVRQVTEHRKPPLVFDDPFVTFDDERAVRAIEMLRDLAADHQVIYLTCSDRYDGAAGAVIVLPAPEVVHLDGDALPEPAPSVAPYELTLPFGPSASEA